MLVCGVSFAALLGVSPAFAGEAGQDGSTPGDEVVVTGSRLRLNGMMTPTPVTVVGADELKAMAPVTMIEAVSQLPQFYANQAPGSTANFFTRGGLGNLNIRGLGINRTLTLLNGRRVVSANAFGGVDISLFPSDMIKSVETVTGGASAAYGTDAVAGVTNFILDTKFTGARLTVQGGETSRSDAANYTVTGAVGFRIGDRGHLLVSGEYFRQDGVNGYQDRDWYQGWGTVPDATGKLLIRPNVVSRNTSYDGMAILAGSALNGLVFRRDGTTFPFVTSDLSSGALGTPAARQSITNGGSGEDIGGSEPTTIYPKLSRKNGFAYADYALTKDLTVFAQYMHGETTDFALNRAGLFGQATAVTIFRDNAYLPQSVQNIMVAENRASFTFKRTGSILDLNKDMSLSDKSVLNSVTTGFNWKIDRPGGLFNGWAVDGYYQYGHNFHRAAQVGFRVDRIFAAIDAVKDPSGKIVCRTSLFNNQFPGCQPLNLFGRGNASAAAVDYVIGFEPGQQVTTPVYYADTGFARGETDSYTSEAAKVTNATMKQNVAELSANGEVFKGWGPGPITAAFGASYRKESIRQIVRDPSNPSNDNTNGHPVLCNTDAAAIAAGLRGVNQADCTNTVGVQQSKISNIKGAIATKELFGETQIPLIAKAPFMQSVRLTAAARWADYTGSGGIWAYKGGLDWEVNDSIRFRGTYSRDVRAANLSERFDKTGGFATVTDPKFPGDGAVSITRFSGGNPAVVPERANTFTAGVVLQPSFLPGFSISADMYRIKINDAIGQLGAQNVLNQCNAGATEICKLVTRDASTGKIVLVGDLFVNISESQVKGIDFEAGYRRSINVFGGGETLNIRAFGSRLTTFSQHLVGAPAINRAGQTGIQQSDGISYSLPKFKGSLNATYIRGPLTVFVQGRYIYKGTFENALVVGKDIESNSVPAVFYGDARVAYRFAVRGAQLEAFVTATNLFDKSPPITPYWGAAGSTVTQFNPNLYDVLGRRFVLGLKAAF